jgi:cytochrome c oxidase subunit 1
MAQQTLPLRRPIDFVSRVCGTTGLRIHIAAQNLILTNAATAIVFLLFGGIMGIMLGLTRWPEISLLSSVPDIYYRFLTAHGMSMLLYWIIFFEIAGLYFGSAIVLNARLIMPKLAWVAYGLMVAGAVLSTVMVLMGEATVMFTAYVPLKASPYYYLGTILFAVGALIAVMLFFATVVVAKAEGRYKGSVPLVTFGLITAAIIAVTTLVGGVLTFVPAFLWSLGLMNLDAEVYRLNFWSIGHPAQQINLAAMVSIWYFIAYVSVGAKPLNEKLSRFAFVLYILFINLGSVHHLLVDPGISVPFKIFNTSYAMYLAVLGSMIHAFSIPGAIESAQRLRGYAKGLFQWIIKAPWSDPAFSSMAISIVVFGFIGGTTGVVMGHEQVNILHHNTMSIPGHLHSTVVGGTTVAFMGLTFYLIPLLARRRIIGAGLAKFQPYIYSFGLLLIIFGQMGAGALGVPRRIVDAFYDGAPVAVAFPEMASLGLSIAGIGAVIAGIGGAIYVGVAVLSLFFGQRIEEGVSLLNREPVTEPQGKTHVKVPGTFVMVFIFLAVFTAVWIGNMLWLGKVWPVN